MGRISQPLVSSLTPPRNFCRMLHFPFTPCNSPAGRVGEFPIPSPAGCVHFKRTEQTNKH